MIVVPFLRACLKNVDATGFGANAAFAGTTIVIVPGALRLYEPVTRRAPGYVNEGARVGKARSALSPTQNVGFAPFVDSMYAKRFLPPFASVREGLNHWASHMSVLSAPLDLSVLRSATRSVMRYVLPC